MAPTRPLSTAAAESRTATPLVGDLQHDRHRIRSSKTSDVSSTQAGNQRVRH
jgi:hypothetical protein